MGAILAFLASRISNGRGAVQQDCQYEDYPSERRSASGTPRPTSDLNHRPGPTPRPVACPPPHVRCCRSPGRTPRASHVHHSGKSGSLRSLSYSTPSLRPPRACRTGGASLCSYAHLLYPLSLLHALLLLPYDPWLADARCSHSRGQPSSSSSSCHVRSRPAWGLCASDPPPLPLTLCS